MTAEDKQTTPDLDKIMVEGLEVFDMDPNQHPGSGPDVEPTAAQPAPGIETKKQKEESAKKPEELSEDPDKDHRFKTHEEAEKAYKTQQAHVTKIEDEKKDLGRKVEQLEERVSGFEAQDQSEKERQALEAADQEILEFSKKRHEEVMAAIEELDPEDAEHSKKVAELWAGLNADIRKFERDTVQKIEAGEAAAPAGEVADHKSGGGQPVKKEIESAAADAGQVGTEDVQYVHARVTRSGRDPQSPIFQRAAILSPEAGESGAELTLDEQIDWALNKEKEIEGRINHEGIKPDDPVWLHFMPRAPVKNEKEEDLSLEDQVGWAMEKTKEHKAAERAKIKQELNLPLSAGNVGRGTKTEGTPDAGISFGAAIDKAVEGRRL